MRLTILGNNGPFPAENGACSGYLLQSKKTNLLIDCGTGTLAALRGLLPMEELTAVVLTHLHFDHMSDMLPMQYALQFASRSDKLPVIAPETNADVRAMLNCPYMQLQPVQSCTIGDMQLSFLRVNHPVETYAIRVVCDGRVFVTTGDTNTCEGLSAFCENANLLLADAAFTNATYAPQKPHLSAELCGKLAHEAHVSRLMLTHINPNVDTNLLLSEAKAVFENTELAVRFAQTSI